MQRNRLRDIKIGVGSFLVTLCLLLTILFPLFDPRFRGPVAAAGENWWDTDWSYRKLVTINESRVETTLTNFPVLVYRAADTDLAADAQDDGDDICFVLFSDNTTQLKHEIEWFDGTTGKLYTWVNVTLSGSADTKLWMYYGHADVASQENIAGTWNSGYTAVLHFNETSGTQYDSTSNNVDTTVVDVAAQGTNIGIVSGADDLERTSTDRVNLTSSNAMNNANGMLEIWFKPESVNEISDDGEKIIGGAYDASNKFFVTLVNTWPTATYSKNLAFSIKHNNIWKHIYSNNDMKAGIWYYANFQWGTNGIKMGINKTRQTLTDASTQYVDHTTTMSIGRESLDPGSEDYYDGIVDEFRFSNIVRNTSWTNATYDTIYTPTAFHFFGVEEEQPAAPSNTAPVISNPNPANESLYITEPFTLLNVTITDIDADTMNITWSSNSSGSWVTFGTNLSINNGSYSQINNNFSKYNYTYWWKVNLSDGNGGYDEEIYHFKTKNTSLVGDYTCWGCPSLCRDAFDKNLFYILYQGANMTDPTTAHLGSYVIYNRSSGWTTREGTDLCISDGKNYGNIAFPNAAFFDTMYHYIHSGYLANPLYEVKNTTWDNLRDMDAKNDNTTLVSGDDWEPVTLYAFNNTKAVAVKTDRDTGQHSYKLLNWSSDDGWESAFWDIDSTDINHCRAVMLPYNKTTWYLYGASGASKLSYAKSIDGGHTWADEVATTVPATVRDDSYGLGFTRYGDSIYVTVQSGDNLCLYTSSNWEDWSLVKTIWLESWDNGTSDGPLGSGSFMVDQDTILYTVSGYRWNNYNPPTDSGIGNQYGGTVEITLMEADPGEPTVSSPANDSTLADDVTSTNLVVTTSGDEVYDVAFYWSNGSFIDVDTLVQGGDTASVGVSGLSLDETYQWYAIARGAIYGYWGEPANTSDQNVSDVFTFRTRDVNWLTIQTLTGIILNASVPSQWRTIQTVDGVIINTSVVSDWVYYRKIIVNHSLVDASLTNFPILVDISGLDGTHVQDDGGDIRFYDSTNSTQYHHEIEYYDDGAGDLLCWVNVTYLSADTDTVIWMSYGNDTCDNQWDVEGTWNSDYTMVQHLNETSGNPLDSTAYDNDGVVTSVTDQDATGIVGPCYDFVEANTDYVNVSNAASLNIHASGGKYTVEVWVKSDDLATDRDYWVSKYTASGLLGYNMGNGITGITGDWNDARFSVLGGSSVHCLSDTDMVTGVWYYAAGVYEEGSSATNQKIYVNGSLETEVNGVDTAGDSSNVLQIGALQSLGHWHDGLLDEIRFSKVARNASWINTTHNTIMSSADFISVGTEEEQPSGVAWHTIQTVSGALQNTTGFKTTQTLQGGLQNITGFKTIQTLSGVIQNTTGFKTVQTLNGVILNATVFKTIQTISGAIQNTSETQWSTIQTTTGVLLNTSEFVWYHNSGGNAYFNINDLHFNPIEITAEYVMFNTTDFKITSVNRTNVTINEINETIIGAGVGDLLVNFTVDNIGGLVWFNLSGFDAGATYDIKRDDVLFDSSTANVSGDIHFSDVFAGVVYDYTIFLASVSPVSWQTVQTTSGLIQNVTLFKTLQTVSGVLLNATGWKTKQTLVGAIQNVSAFRTIQTLSGAITNTTGFRTVQTLNGAIQNTTGFRTIQTINGIIMNVSGFKTVQMISGQINNITQFKTIQTLDGLIQNTTNYKTIQTLSGLIQNTSRWITQQTITGDIFNVSGFKTIQTLSGQIHNTTGFKTAQTINGLIKNTTQYKTIQTINGIITNVSNWKIVQTLSGTIQNISGFKTIQTIAGAIFNTTGFKTIQTMNGNILNTTQWVTAQTISGDILNTTAWATVQILDGFIFNSSQSLWKTTQTINGTLLNATSWRTSQTLDGSIHNILFWNTIQTMNGEIKNITSWRTTQTINGDIFNTSGFKTIQSISGLMQNTTQYKTIQTINGGIFNNTGFKTTQTLSGLIQNTSHWITRQTLTGIISNTSNWYTTQTLNGTILNASIENITLSSIFPVNASTGVVLHPLCSVDVNHSDGELMTLNWYENSTGSWILRQTNSNVGNGTYTYHFTQASSYSTKYWWNLTVNDTVHNLSTWYYFTTEAFVPPVNNPPNTPSNPTPANNSINVDLNQNLSWTGGDPDGDPVLYDVYFNISLPLILVSANQSGVIYDPGTMILGTTYYWRIVAWDDSSARTSGPIWEFTTATTTWITVDTINGIIMNITYGVQIINIYPANQSHITKNQPTLLFTLYNSTGSSNFTVYTGNSTLNATSFLFNDSYVGNSTFNGLYYNATEYYTPYYWRVTVWDNGGWTNETYYFEVVHEGGNSIPISDPLSILGIFGVFGIIAFIIAIRKRKKQGEQPKNDKPTHF